MTTNNRYLPLFFLCWAFLYGPFLLLGIGGVDGSKPKTITEVKYKAGQGSQHSVGRKSTPYDFTCFCTRYGNAAWGFTCNLNFMVPFNLNEQAGGSYGGK